MPDEKPSGDVVPSFPWVAPDDGICDVYSNFLHLHWTLFDVRIRFGQIVPNPEQPPITAGWTINEWAAVTIPWGQAKALQEMLHEAVKKYEAVNGEITIPTLPT
jgi:hypothetical protein